MVLWGGDFRQILPVVEKGSREDIVYACIQRSPLWPHVHIFHLTQNMRLGQTPLEQDFAQWLLSVGEGTNVEHTVMEYTMSLLAHVRIDGATEEEAMERFLQAPYPGISNPGPRRPHFQHFIKAGSTDPIVNRWAKFSNKLTTIFSNPNFIGKASDKILTLHMKRQAMCTGTDKLSWPNNILHHLYYNSLANHIKDLWERGEPPANFECLVRGAQNANNCYWNHIEEKKADNNSG